ncbi:MULTISPECIES: Asp23/Gls24 family envelope stress response protein [Thermaerobacter]|uniref:Asp23/Gls24 family envelope stress response protein n=1 Tax=Thermaerobacter composti TaxID=554949 RepID=A0ABZ0QRL8_9FIRM|nr:MULTISPECIES: Asp23/Gls24 family envelope stress response protein [Thermaerobacter]QBS37972.1 Asp23/Gls24 family envelope stress response protein [Thermaerobacter sp. FW80]WPD20142.1 Asp23/Gls24 family envelope stress response protein [Thermaerobacter composti]
MDEQAEFLPLPGEDEGGHIRIASEVVSVIAGIAAMEIDGVAGMASGGLVGGLSEMLGWKNLGKGVKVEVGERECTIDLFMIVRYGVRIPQVAERVQDNVKRAVETMTGLRVRSVNIHIQGVAFPEAQREAEARAK